MVDDGVRVLLKTGLEGRFEFGDLAVGLGNDPHQWPNSCPVCVRDRWGCAEVGASEALLYLVGSFV